MRDPVGKTGGGEGTAVNEAAPALATILCGCGRPTSHRGICRSRYKAKPRYMRNAIQMQRKVTRSKRRFTQHTPAGNPYTLALDHPAVVEGRTMYAARREAGATMERLFKGAENNRKIGGNVLKGALRGARVVTLTLEERATCPRSCTHWRDCYGNNMNWSVRIQADDDLQPLLEAELRKLCARNRILLVRLHVLGDFFSVGYVAFWRRMLDTLPGLHVYGYTARNGCDIAEAIDELNEHPRSWIRFSDGDEGQLRAVTVDSIDQAREAGAIVCPVQTGKTDCCGTCALCWSTPKTIAFLRH